jgi:hypothetical protein
VTPDSPTLPLAESYDKRLAAFDIAAFGGSSNLGYGPTSKAVSLTASALTLGTPY